MMAARSSAKQLEAARLRLRSRFQSKFPTVWKQPASEPKIDVRNDPGHLEAARLRIHKRFRDNFPAATTPAVPNWSVTESPNAGHRNNLEAARLRIRERFQRKFLPDFGPFPETLDTAVCAMEDEWGKSNAVVVTSAKPPYRILGVNTCWEELCGYTQREVFGETFPSLGIQGSLTEPWMLISLSEKLSHGERAAIHLSNVTKNGTRFTNYLRVAPLTDKETGIITHFIGVLEKDDSLKCQHVGR